MEAFEGIKAEMLSIAVLGGDKRQLVLIDQLKKQGFSVKSLAVLSQEADYALGDRTDVIILPIPGLDEAGYVQPNGSAEGVRLSKEWVQGLDAQTVILVGRAPKYLQDWCEASGIKLISYLSNEAYQIANAVPTAEGALYLSMESRKSTIFGSRSVVCGFGRCGMALALRLQALGSLVTVVARKSGDRALGESMGLSMIDYAALATVLPEADLIYNTVPHLVLDYERLLLLKKSCFIVDLASAPGGCDFEACGRLGINGVLATSLPGRYFSDSAGLILANTLVDMICGNFSLSANLEMGGC